jgi:hypothetical protein
VWPGRATAPKKRTAQGARAVRGQAKLRDELTSSAILMDSAQNGVVDKKEEEGVDEGGGCGKDG